MHTPHPRRTKIGGNLYRPELPQDAIWAARQARGYSRSAYANPHPVGKPCKPCGGTVHDLDESLHLYGQYLDNNPQIVDQAAAEPTGARFACWCKLTQPCHLDQLLTRIGHREH